MAEQIERKISKTYSSPIFKFSFSRLRFHRRCSARRNPFLGSLATHFLDCDDFLPPPQKANDYVGISCFFLPNHRH